MQKGIFGFNFHNLEILIDINECLDILDVIMTNYYILNEFLLGISLLLVFSCYSPGKPTIVLQ